jgi:hypothetical protein
MTDGEGCGAAGLADVVEVAPPVELLASPALPWARWGGLMLMGSTPYQHDELMEPDEA